MSDDPRFTGYWAAIRADLSKQTVDAVIRLADNERAAAWDEGHLTRWRRGPDECQCCAYSAGECACGKYGTGELLSLAQNPYREPQS